MIKLPPAGMSSSPHITAFSEKDFRPFDLNATLKGKLSVFKSPQVKLRIGEHLFDAILDTGSYHSHISTGAFHALALKKASGFILEEHPEIGPVEVPAFKIKFHVVGIENELTEMFALLPTDYQFPFILGSHFISRCKEFIIHGPHDSFTLTL